MNDRPKAPQDAMNSCRYARAERRPREADMATGTPLAAALAASIDGAVALDRDNKVVLWNRAAEGLLGHRAHEVAGRSCCEVFAGAPEIGECLCAGGRRTRRLSAETGGVQSFDLQAQTKGGRDVWLHVIAASARDGAAGPLTVYLFRDVTAARDLLRMIGEPAPVAARPDPRVDLTRREREILRLVATGLSTKAIAERLRVSPATIRNHVQNILAKLDVHSRIQAVAYVNAHRLL